MLEGKLLARDASPGSGCGDVAVPGERAGGGEEDAMLSWHCGEGSHTDGYPKAPAVDYGRQEISPALVRQLLQTLRPRVVVREDKRDERGVEEGLRECHFSHDSWQRASPGHKAVQQSVPHVQDGAIQAEAIAGHPC